MGRIRLGKAAAALPLLLALTAAKQAVTPIPETMVAVDTDHKVGEAFDVKPGDVVLRAHLYESFIVQTSAPMTVSIGKFTQDIAAGTKLDAVMAPDTTIRNLKSDGLMFCGEDQRSRSQFAELMIGSMFSKYETIVRFCFIDTDKNGTLDQVFLAGAREPLEQVAVAIDAIPYERRRYKMDDPHAVMELRVGKLHKKSNKIEYHLIITDRNGERRNFTYLLTVERNAAVQTYPNFKTNPKKFPYPSHYNNVLGASITTVAVDGLNQTAQVKVNRRFKTQWVKPINVVVNYIYVYY